MNYYEVLQVRENASPEEIRASYLRLAQQYHPDRHTGEVESAAARSRFNAIQEAYEILHNAEQRRIYDRRHTVPQPRGERHAAEAVRSNIRAPRDIPQAWLRRGVVRRRRRPRVRGMIFVGVMTMLAVTLVPRCSQYFEANLLIPVEGDVPGATLNSRPATSRNTESLVMFSQFDFNDFESAESNPPDDEGDGSASAAHTPSRAREALKTQDSSEPRRLPDWLPPVEDPLPDLSKSDAKDSSVRFRAIVGATQEASGWLPDNNPFVGASTSGLSGLPNDYAVDDAFSTGTSIGPASGMFRSTRPLPQYQPPQHSTSLPALPRFATPLGGAPTRPDFRYGAARDIFSNPDSAVERESYGRRRGFALSGPIRSTTTVSPSATDSFSMPAFPDRSTFQTPQRMERIGLPE